MELAARTASNASGSGFHSSKDLLITFTDGYDWQLILANSQKSGLDSMQTMLQPICAKEVVAVPGPLPISRILEDEESRATLMTLSTSALGYLGLAKL
jgi:hypothetical protein